MATYRELLAQKRELDERIEAVRAEAAHEALASVRAAIAEFGFTPDEVFGKPRREKAARGERKAAGAKRERTARRHANLDLFGDGADKA
ncbi:MAG TPA: H-NS family nucleoid-associated regulatory protein [Paraburkholderia sp.]|uniref:H-NS family nucleoid-associated regulatory protein n=1 Tax=Paraburkholderia sp. TaxID=1926495 RepID=UPI002B45B629|nr:H-NS family nucleoid-associated regulatory protein [Paraburkholderia sp.]HKR47635.1 H-NS family nucleoid-associated regulatory protein [Paraburkholderia sp.]